MSGCIDGDIFVHLLRLAGGDYAHYGGLKGALQVDLMGELALSALADKC